MNIRGQYAGIITYIDSNDRFAPLKVSKHPITYWKLQGGMDEGIDWIRGDHRGIDRDWTDDALAMLAAYKLTESAA